MKTWCLAAGMLWCVAAGAAERPPVAPFETTDAVARDMPLDRLIAARLRRERLAFAPLCSDAVFVRRVHLDVLGRLPDAATVRRFLADAAPDKRARLVDEVIARPEFADYWAMRWADVLRVKSEFPINLWPNAVQAYHGWLRACLRDHVPWDRVARQLLTACGGCGREPAVNFYRAVQDRSPAGLSQAAALMFLGQRVERWPKERRDGFAAFFSQVGYKSTLEWKEEIVVWDPWRATNGAPLTRGVLPDGREVALTPDRDPRAQVADWLFAPGNPAFSRAVVNRMMAWVFGRGFVEEADDLRADHPSSQPEAFAWLAGEWVSARYDLHQLVRMIVTSRTYQQSAIPASPDPRAAGMLAQYPVRRLDAEVLMDALCDVTGTTEDYSSQIPEPFSFLPSGERAVEVADASVTSSFLELFGRPARDTGLMSERLNRLTGPQYLHLLNSTQVRRKLNAGPGVRDAVKGVRSRDDAADRLYLHLLSRAPTDAERATFRAYAPPDAPGGERDAVSDLAWALVNSTEFLHRH